MLVQSSEHFQQCIASAGNKLIVVDFFATWCGPCVRIAPVLEQLAVEFANYIMVLKVDVDQLGELSQLYGIRSMPTFVFIKGGQIIEQFSGASAELLRNAIERLK